VARGAASQGGGQSSGSTSTGGGAVSANAYADDAGVGSMARILLRAAPARRLVVEIAHVSGRQPSQQALGHLKAILQRELAKPAGIEFDIDAEITNPRDSYTLSNLLSLESRYRRQHSNGDTATIWIAALNGSYSGGSSTLGLSFRATAFALFEDQIQQAANVFVSSSSIERSVITHEMGHLLALINIGYRSHYDHEDPQHPHHSKFQTSVMYWAVEETSISTILQGGPPDDFDQYDRADLALLRG
jgi:hypothetical protein